MRSASFQPSTLLLITALAITAPVGAAQTGNAQATGSTSADGVIYRCEDESGIPRFSQFPCRTSGRRAGRVDLDPVQIVRTVPLGADERRRLDALERERQRRLQARDRTRRQALNQSRRQQRARLESCRAARAGLNTLRQERRRGYSLRRATVLERREAELDVRIRSDC